MKKLIVCLLSTILVVSMAAEWPFTLRGATVNENDNNDTFNDAMLVTLGSTVNGRTGAGYDWDYYKFISGENGKISINFTNLEPNEVAQHGIWSLFLYGPNKEEIGMTTVDLTEKKTVELPFIGAKAGNYYYLLVYPGPNFASGHSYQISTSFTKGSYYEKEANNTEASAGRMILAHDYVGTIGADFLDGDSNEVYDRDYYHIKAPAKGRMTMFFKHKTRTGKLAHSGWAVALYKHQNGGNVAVSQASVKLNSKNNLKFYSGTMDKGADLWLNVKSTQDYSLTNGKYTFVPSDILGEPYTVSTTFILDAKPKIKTKAKKNSITISAKKIADVTGYEIEMKRGKTFKKLATTNKSTLKYTKKRLKKNKRYTFRVRAYLKADDTKYYGNWVVATAKTKKK
ncbi:MAG: fibronectin type III domain-containing protein [Eubacterium sp.]|nr:fibronectin type III domain-containing protein [Eubacterium sp.]